MHEILINLEAGERRVAILSSGKLEWYFVERITERRIVGNIYMGRVNSVLNGMGAAFVECGLEKNGFLYVDDITAPVTGDEDDDLGASEEIARPHKKVPSNAKISDLIKKDQEIMVQIVKEGLGTKGARLTTHISLPGRYLVFMPTLKRVGVSRKIRDVKERQRIRSVLRELKLPDNMGLVARTAAVGCGKDEFLRDVRYFQDTYNRIKKLAKSKPAPSLIFEELDLSSKVMRDYLSDDTTKVIIDDKQEYKKVKSFTARIARKFTNRVVFYKGETPLFEKHKVEKDIDKLFERKIFLRCGGHITIEQTEGMVAIDVNSGKFTGKKNLEETISKVNREAAEEVARQLRLRDIGGIVIIDFIDMEMARHRKEVFSILQSALRKDKAKTNIISMSELNIVEMTRQRVRRSLESTSYQNCPNCAGKGMVKSADTVAIVALRKLKTYLKTHRARATTEVTVHPLVAQRLVNEDAPSLDYIRRKFRRHVSVVADDKLHIEGVNIAPARHR
ncbi:MAG: Rne/Rng family ribonuclease [Candidatus Omnitrophica bacterium]|nr:Rne/Rng family ribonuclease [Candidatus Omnitrophota bacterium]